MSDVEELVKKEPWRRGQGQPINALDPTWNIERSRECTGEIDYEAGTNWWWCKKCGYCNKLSYTTRHKPIRDPFAYLMTSIDEFIKTVPLENRELRLRQLFHVAGVAIRYAARKSPAELEAYVQQLIVP